MMEICGFIGRYADASGAGQDVYEFVRRFFSVSSIFFHLVTSAV